nr:MAG TPA: hypothetical protein [Caudoviricetes sp.]
MYSNIQSKSLEFMGSPKWIIMSQAYSIGRCND